MPFRSILVLTLSLLLFTSCKSSESAYQEKSSGVTVKATNRNFKAVEVYAVSAGRRVLLGRLSAGATRTYDLPAEIFANDLSIRFQLESVDRTINILTDTILAAPGEEIILIIPNEG